MKAEINMINVEDGDCIILTLRKEESSALILIDGGYKKHYPKLKSRLEELLPDFDNTIRLVVCTHYDNDHLGGVEKVIESYHEAIEEIWIHKIADTLGAQIDLMKERLAVLEKSEESVSRLKYLAGFEAYGANSLVEGYKDLLRVIEKIESLGLEDKVREVTRGDYLEGFEEFSVVSPTGEYYNSYLDELKKEAFQEDVRNHVSERVRVAETFENFTDSESLRREIDRTRPCEKLKKSSVENGVTPTNMVSIVTLLKFGGKKYLFTGDAGIETFESQKILDDDLKDLHWLDLPHHGSKNNTSKTMLDHFNPEVVFVSGKGIDNRPHYRLTDCLNSKRTGSNIHVTNAEADTWYLSFDDSGKLERVKISQ